MAFVFVTAVVTLSAQGSPCPSIWGIAKMTFLVSDFNLARSYYGDFLGFEECFSYQSKEGTVLSFKVNDRQFLEFIEDAEAKEKKRMVSVSLEVDNVQEIGSYLVSKNVRIIRETESDGAGNEVMAVDDGYGNKIEFISFRPESLHKQSEGKFLSERRISTSIHHAGLYTDKVKNDDPFYVGILNCNEIIRYPENWEELPIMIYYALNSCAEYIEHYADYDPNTCHPCFLVDNMQETNSVLRERNNKEMMLKPVVGRGNRWILNLKNPDGSKVEFTEAYRVR
jgi:catechol 2,3-dioxygenase-like lactoylglutathione lyase family enzyme